MGNNSIRILLIKRKHPKLNILLLSIGAIVILQLSAVRSYAQTTIVKGHVTDATGNALSGVTVSVQGTTTGVITGANGDYVIKASPNSTLIFRYIGYGNQMVKVNDRSTVDLVLRASTQSLDQVVVIGYGSVKKGDLTGSVGQVNMGDLVKAPVASFADALAGRVAGVQVSSNDGQPGSGVNIVIRGAGSLTQDVSPLYVVDGFPIEDFDPGYLSPSDIESITVLKDASSTAIYGARGANGVIVIETKKGTVGSPVINYKGSYGINQVTKRMDMMSPYEFAKFELARWPEQAVKALFPDFPYTPGGQLPDPSIYKNVRGTDWQDRLFRSGATAIHNLSIRGGTAHTKYLVSGSIFNQDGTVINTGYNRYQGKLSLDQDINNKLKVGVDFTYVRIKNYGTLASQNTISGYGMSTLFYNVWGYRPVAPPGVDLDNLLIDPDIDSRTDLRINPVISTENEQQNRYVTGILANVNFTWTIAKGLSLRVQGGLDNKVNKNDYFFNSQTGRGTPLRPGNLQGVQGGVSFGQRDVWSNENTLSYDKKFNRNNLLNVVVGVSAEGINVENYGLNVTEIPNEELGLSGLDEGLPSTNSAALSDSRLSSYFARANYDFKSKYLFTVTFRADGSSKFAPQNRWGYFPSGAFAWKMSDEEFMKNLSFISDAKLRASYGLTGNNRVGDFSYLPSIRVPVTASYSFNNQTPSNGAIQSDFGNAALKWETTSQLDIGYDLTLFNSRVTLTADVYRKITSNLLLNSQVPYVTGFSTAYKNIGKLQNDGLELSFNTVNVHSGDFDWESTFNISFNRNKVLSLNEGQNFILSTVAWDPVWNNQFLYMAQVGKPAAQFIGLLWDGIYQVGDFDVTKNSDGSNTYVLKNSLPASNGGVRSVIQPGDIKYKDLNGDGVVNDLDRTVIGRAFPIHTGGFGNDFRYKNFSLNVFLQWSYGNDIMNANRIYFEGDGDAKPLLNQFASYANYWTFDNPSNKYFGTNNSSRGTSGVYSTRTIEDGSFLRLKTVALAYKIPAGLLQKLKIRSLDFSISGQNLFTWTKYSGMDPEVSVRNSVLTPGLDFSAYPRARTIVFSVDASF
jgi:TonB-linked SusC/RagA family outer membrane protein